MRNGLIFVLILISTISLFHFYSDSFYSLNLLEQKKINKILILNNRYFSDKYFISKLSIFEGESFYKFNPYTLKKELDKIQEIKSYLDARFVGEEKYPKFVIVDDKEVVSKGHAWANRFVKTKSEIGLTNERAQRMIESLERV